jgi:hypothetical protein
MKSASCGHTDTSADTDGKSTSSDMICLNNITDHGHEGTFEDAYKNIWRFIEKVYNKKRLHSAFGYKSPEKFEVEFALNTVA